MTVKTDILKISEIIKAKPFVDFAYLFGSRAKNTASEKSDWDIAIHFNKYFKKLPKWTSFYLEAEISKEVGNEVQIIVLDDIYSPTFLFQIINEGLLIVDNNAKKRIIFEANILKRYHDWNYILRRQMMNKLI